MVSDFLLPWSRLNLFSLPKRRQEELEEAGVPLEAAVLFEYGKEDGYWDGKMLLRQALDRALPVRTPIPGPKTRRYQLGQKTTIVDCDSNRPVPYDLYIASLCRTLTSYSPPGRFVPNLHQGAHISRGPQVSRTHLSAAVSPRMEWQIKRTALPCHGSNPRPIAIDYYVRTPMGRVLRA